MHDITHQGTGQVRPWLQASVSSFKQKQMRSVILCTVLGTGIVVHVYNSSTQEAEAEGRLKLKYYKLNSPRFWGGAQW
jgi:hypothetical protein